MLYSCVLLASKSQWRSRPQRKRHRSSNDDDDDDGGGSIENDTLVQAKKDSNLAFMTAKDQYVSAPYNFYAVEQYNDIAHNST